MNRLSNDYFMSNQSDWTDFGEPVSKSEPDGLRAELPTIYRPQDRQNQQTDGGNMYVIPETKQGGGVNLRLFCYLQNLHNLSFKGFCFLPFPTLSQGPERGLQGNVERNRAKTHLTEKDE